MATLSLLLEPNPIPERYTVNVNRFSKILAMLAMTTLVATAISAPINGKWTGRINAKFSPAAGSKSGISAEQIKKQNELLGKILIILVLDVKGTYTSTSRIPGVQEQVGKGTWKLSGKKLTLVPSDKRTPEVGTLSANGKILTINLPATMSAAGIKGKAIFKKS
jgi:hypothetical protein